MRKRSRGLFIVLYLGLAFASTKIPQAYRLYKVDVLKDKKPHSALIKQDIKVTITGVEPRFDLSIFKLSKSKRIGSAVYLQVQRLDGKQFTSAEMGRPNNRLIWKDEKGNMSGVALSIRRGNIDSNKVTGNPLWYRFQEIYIFERPISQKRKITIIYTFKMMLDTKPRKIIFAFKNVKVKER